MTKRNIINKKSTKREGAGKKKLGRKALALSLITALTLVNVTIPLLAQETDDDKPEQVMESNQYTLIERLGLAKELGVTEYMEEDGYLSDTYAHSLSYVEMSSGVGPLLRVVSHEDALENEELFRYQTDIKEIQSGGISNFKAIDLGLSTLSEISPISSYYIATYNMISHSNGMTYGSKFTAFTPAGLIDVFCGDFPVSTPVAGDELTNITEITNVNVLKALYYGYGGPEAIESKSNDFYLETANSVSYYINGYSSGHSVSESYRTIIEDKSAPLSGFKVYTSQTNGGSTQDILYSVYEPEGGLTITKSSSNPSVTNGSSCYSLTGAEYGVYTTSSGATYNTASTKAGTLTTTSSGSANTLTLDAGTYYVKETKAPTGYILDQEVHTVTVTAGNTITLPVSDDPHYDPVGIMVTKSDSGTGE